MSDSVVSCRVVNMSRYALESYQKIDLIDCVASDAIEYLNLEMKSEDCLEFKFGINPFQHLNVYKSSWRFHAPSLISRDCGRSCR